MYARVCATASFRRRDGCREKQIYMLAKPVCEQRLLASDSSDFCHRHCNLTSRIFRKDTTFFRI